MSFCCCNAAFANPARHANILSLKTVGGTYFGRSRLETLLECQRNLELVCDAALQGSCPRRVATSMQGNMANNARCYAATEKCVGARATEWRCFFRLKHRCLVVDMSTAPHCSRGRFAAGLRKVFYLWKLAEGTGLICSFQKGICSY